MLALPYRRFHCPDLTRRDQIAHHATHLHLHDLVVSAPLRRRGLGTRLVRHLTDAARGRASRPSR
ncbi:GNAT family N-acetyltransferase [Streptomyces tricolor]|nr:GNAT family N-acetyltransferase [Streptomyces tricolor]